MWPYVTFYIHRYLIQRSCGKILQVFHTDIRTSQHQLKKNGKMNKIIASLLTRFARWLTCAACRDLHRRLPWLTCADYLDSHGSPAVTHMCRLRWRSFPGVRVAALRSCRVLASATSASRCCVVTALEISQWPRLLNTWGRGDVVVFIPLTHLCGGYKHTHKHTGNARAHTHTCVACCIWRSRGCVAVVGAAGAVQSRTGCHVGRNSDMNPAHRTAFISIIID